jgi:TetR/AcrR family transcriptional repressor of bet genes
MPRPRNTDQRRAQIVSGFMRIMAERGYDGTSVAEAARAAGLTQGLVHYHFKSKQEILVAALSQLVEQHDAQLTQRLEEVPNGPGSEVDAFIDFHLGLGADANPEALACWIHMSGEALRQAEVRSEWEKALTATAERLTEIIHLGIAQGVFDCESAQASATAIVAAIQGYFVLAATARSVIPKGTAAPSVKRMAQGLLRQQRSSNSDDGGSR